MDRPKSVFKPRNLIICVATCTVAALWAVVFAALYFYFFGGAPGSPPVQNVSEPVSVAPYRRDLLPWYLNGTVYPGTAQDDDMVALWPHQLPRDPLQRLQNQLMFVPKGSAETRIVLFWSDWSSREMMDYKVSQCPVNSCVFTSARRSLSKANAVVFRHPTTLLTDFPEEFRPRSQVWIFNSLSAPGQDFVHPRDVFNWTATPRLDADLPMFPHGVWMYFNPTWRHQHPPLGLAQHKTLAAAAWFPSRCNTASRGYRLVEDLLKAHTLVDGFSSDAACGEACPQGRPEVCVKLLRDKYRVTLVLEDWQCNHTIPDMFYTALEAHTVPVVMSPPRSVYEQLVPEDSFIHASDFSSPYALARHLDTIYADDAVYNHYLSWHGTGLFVKSWYCRLCAMLHHNNLPELTIDDVNQWWNPEGECPS